MNIREASYTLPGGHFSVFVYANKLHLKSLEGNNESGSRRFTGPPTLSRLTAASLSRKETKRIKECKQRRDETLAIWAHGIRQNAEWQKHVLFSHLNQERKVAFLKLRWVGSRQQRCVFTRVSE